MNIPITASHHTMQNWINCYVKETGAGEWRSTDELGDVTGILEKEVLVIELKSQPITLFVPVRYHSQTERHLFSPRMYYRFGEGSLQDLNLLSLLSFLRQELEHESDEPVESDDLMLRTMLSLQTMKRILKYREADLETCYQTEKNFLQSEQSLIIGHQMHPTPKSRQGIDDDEEAVFSPELKGKFQLHYFRADKSLVDESSALSDSATKLIKEELVKDSAVSAAFKAKYCGDDGWSVLPVHPLQARKLIGREDVCQLIQSGRLSYLGPAGKEFYPTSSVRTVYHPESPFMYKFSIPVKITNSLRVNKQKELARGEEVSELLHAGIATALADLHPSFRIIEDPAYINLAIGEEESGFEVMLRDNPFTGHEAERTTLLAALCQDHVAGRGSHLSAIIHGISISEGVSLEQASSEWFSRYLNRSLRPMYWLYATYGIALEAHQQNSVIKLDAAGYPDIFYYRDNQGYYFMESKMEDLKKLKPDLNQKSDTVCSDAIAEERFRYYVFFNHLFGLINGFGTAGLVDEQKLLDILQEEIRQLQREFGDHTSLLASLLYAKKLPCKANLLTRVMDMDELTGSLAEQSVYVEVDNPLTAKVGELK